jgi:serine/threonine-protein kinase
MTIARSDWPRLLTLVEQALDVPAPERATWLASLALPASVAVALRGLLEDRRAIETGGFLTAMPILPGTRPPPEPIPGCLVSGAGVGPWRLLRELGEGGMSTVWLAERADGQGRRQAALKLPHAGPGQELLARRLQHERDFLATLEHRHIARLYDVGVTAAGLPYLVMEYVEGETLIAHADARRLTVAERLACFRQVLSAVQYAHGKLVLHRDLKPANILVDGQGDVKLLDFGIAKVLAPSSSSAAITDLTRLAGRRLTPAYASPEQLRGESLSTASDVYSLGLVLYELLCGQRPFDTKGATPGQIEHAILSREPRPLGKVTLEAQTVLARSATASGLRKTLAGDLNAIVLKALARSPERRYTSVEALDADVARWLAGKPVEAHPPGAAYYLAKFLARNRWAVGSATLAALALATVSGVALHQARLASQLAERAGAVRDFLVAMFDATDPNHAEGQPLSAKTLLESGRRRALDKLDATPDLKAQLLQAVANAQANLGDRTGADRTYADVIDAWLRSGDERDRVLSLLARVDNLLALGRVADADTLLKEAITASARFGEDAAVTGTLLREQGYVAVFRRDWPAARDVLQHWLALADRHPGMSPQDRVDVLENLATASARSGDLAGALARIAQARETLRQHPELPAGAQMDVANYRQDIEYQWGRYADIERTSPASIRECDRRLSPQSATCLKLKLRLQLARLRLGRVDEALALNAELAPLLDPSSPRDQLVAASAIARGLARGGALAARPELVQQLLDIVRTEGATALDANFIVVGLAALAEIEVLARRPEQALAWVAQGERLASTSVIVSGEIHRLQALKGVALGLQGRHALALAALAPLCAGVQEPASMTRVQDTLLSLNCVTPLVAGGRRADAVTLLRQALPVLRDGLGDDSPTVRQAQAWLAALQSTGTLPPAPDVALTLFT